MEKVLIRGEGGGGGDKSHTPVKAPNTLATATTARVLFLISDGETGGLVDQSNPLKSVFLNNTPVMSADGTTMPGILIPFEAVGLPSQPVAQGYPSSSTTYSPAQKVTISAPQSYTALTSDVDAIRITIRFPALVLAEEDGDEVGTEVSFNILRNIDGGPFSLYKAVTVRDKCIAPADIDYLVPRSGTGLMGVRVVRVTADSTSTTLRNEIYFQYATEIKNAQLSYPNRAYIGLTLTTETTGTTYPTVSFDYLGIKVKVPSNYDSVAATYSGAWDGTFKVAKEVCSNPVWVLYDLLTSERHGMGKFVKSADIDQYSFYDSAFYCDQLVPNEFATGFERRFTFNYQFTERVRGWELLQNVASSFCAQIFTAGNRIKLIQDRALTGFSRLITNSNVENGSFEYSDTGATTRISAATVNWNDPAQNMTSVPAYYEDTDQVALVGLNLSDTTKLGCTSRGEALRYAKHLVETGKSNSEAVTFTVGAKQAGILPGWLIKISDQDYAQVTNYGRLISSTANTITFDQPLTIDNGNTFDVVAGDGQSIETRTFVSGGPSPTFTFGGGAISAMPGADVIITGAISPRLFKVISVKETSPLKWAVNALHYEANKFARIDNTPEGPTPVFQGQSTVPTSPVGVTFREGATNIDNVIKFTLMCSWNRPASGQVQNYIFRWRRSSQPWIEVTLTSTSFQFPDVKSGLYEVEVYARSSFGNLSPPAEASYNLLANWNGTGLPGDSGTGPSALFAPINLGEYLTGTDVFAEDDLNVKFTNPSGNTADRGTLRDFQVRIYKTSDSQLMRIEYVPPVPPGANQVYSYSYEKNVLDHGIPSRSVRLEVRCRDSSYNLSAEAARTFTNIPPGVPSGITITAAFNTVGLSWRRPEEADAAGVLIWSAGTADFELSEDTLLFDTTDTFVTDIGLLPGKPRFYVLAAYDSFGKDFTGATLNKSVTMKCTPLSKDFDTNKARNSSFEGRAPGIASRGDVANQAALPIEFVSVGDAYTTIDNGHIFVWNGSIWIDNGITPPRPDGYTAHAPGQTYEWLNEVGFASDRAFALRCLTAVSGQPFGLKFMLSETPDLMGISGGWLDGQDYAISFKAKKINGANWGGMQLGWTNDPQLSVGGTGVSIALKNPLLTTEWQTYSFHIAWSPDALVEPDGQLYIFPVGNTAIADEIIIDLLQVETGSISSGWAPRVDELYAGVITETYVGKDAITTPKLAANSVIAGKIQSYSIETRHLQTETFVSITGWVQDRFIAGDIQLTGITQANGILTNPSIFAGGFTQAYQWPVGLGGGFHLSPQGLLIGNPAAGSPGYVQINADGSDIQFGSYLYGGFKGLKLLDGNAFFSGSLTAASGTFAGSLSAATGTFSGSLSAATGTFSGNLSGASGTFSGDLVAARISVGTASSATQFFDPANSDVSINSSADGALSYDGTCGAVVLTSNNLLFKNNDSNWPRERRIRTGNVNMFMMCTATVDDQLSIWYRVNGGNWNWLSGVHQPQSGDGPAATGWGMNLYINSGDTVQFGASPTDGGYYTFDTNKLYLKGMVTTVTIRNF